MKLIIEYRSHELDGLYLQQLQQILSPCFIRIIFPTDVELENYIFNETLCNSICEIEILT